MNPIIDLGQDGQVLGVAKTEESGVTTFISWSALAAELKKAGVGRLDKTEFFKQIKADQHGITLRIGTKV